MFYKRTLERHSVDHIVGYGSAIARKVFNRRNNSIVAVFAISCCGVVPVLMEGYIVVTVSADPMLDVHTIDWEALERELSLSSMSLPG